MQVSYHPPSDFTPVQISLLKAGATALSIPGASDAFVKKISLPSGQDDNVYVFFQQGVVQIAFGGPAGSLTDQMESAVTAAILS